MIAAEFGTGQVFWSLLWLSLFCIWVWMFIMVFGDLIRSRRLSGWGKALWALFIIVLRRSSGALCTWVPAAATSTIA